MVLQYPLFRWPSAMPRLLLATLPLLLTVCVLTGFAEAADRGERSSVRSPGKGGEVTIKELEFKKTKVQDAVRVISELTGTNIVATTEAGERQITFFIRNLSVEDIVDSLCRIAGLWYRYNSKSGTFVIMTTDEYQRDIVVFRNEPTRIFQLKYLNVGIAARTIADLFGDRVQLKGKANRHYGDDYLPGEADSEFSIDYDKGDMEDTDDSSVSQSTKKETKTTKTKKKTTKNKTTRQGANDDESLSSAKLSLLEELQAEQSQMVAGATMDKVLQDQTEASIYVTVNRMHNLLLVRTSDEKAMVEIARIIEESDQQIPEVLLEMKVLEVQVTDDFKSAFDISSISGSDKTGPDDGQAINPLNPSAGSVGSTLVGSGNSALMENSTMVFQVLSGSLRMRLQLLEAEGNISSIATPMLLAANNHPARLFIGEEAILTTGFSSQQTSATASTAGNTYYYTPVPETETRSIGNTLSILPSINADRSVVMRIVHENSTVVTDGGKIPVLLGSEVQYASVDTVDTSTLEGTVLAQDGMTVAIGGMMRRTKNDSSSKVPVLGDIPLLGFFFREDSKSDVKTELILLITPHVLTAPSQGEEVTRRRLNALTAHPNDVDVYFDEMDRSRQETKAAKEGKGGGGVVSGLQQSFIDLTRVAAKQVRLPLLKRLPEGRIKSIYLAAMGEVPLFLFKGVRATPVAAWTNGSHYVTAIKVENTNSAQVVLDVGKMRGTWHAATLEAQQLAPAGKDGDFTYLYVISDKPFAQQMGLEGK